MYENKQISDKVTVKNSDIYYLVSDIFGKLTRFCTNLQEFEVLLR